MGATGSELNALRIVLEEGGETSSQMISRKMGVDTGYARLLCASLARADYLDILTWGKFRITLKGKNALGGIWPQRNTKSRKRKSPRKGATIDFDWKAATKGQQRGPDYGSSQMKRWDGQLAWNPVKIDQKGIVYSGRDKILRETENQCGFCKGKGEKPKGTNCSVCKGKGVISVQPPAVICAYCKGRGEYPPRANLSCTVCGGKGYVTVLEPIEACGHCRGTGAEPNNKLPCLVCRGKGVITKKHAVEGKG